MKIPCVCVCVVHLCVCVCCSVCLCVVAEPLLCPSSCTCQLPSGCLFSLSHHAACCGNGSEWDAGLPVGGRDREMSFYWERGAVVCVGFAIVGERVSERGQLIVSCQEDARLRGLASRWKGSQWEMEKMSLRWRPHHYHYLLLPPTLHPIPPLSLQHCLHLLSPLAALHRHPVS